MRGKKPYIPLYTDLTGKKVMVAGEGETAAQMLRYLARFSDDLYLLTSQAPDPGSMPQGKVTLLHKPYERSDLYGMDYVVCLTEDAKVSEDICVTCRTLGIRLCTGNIPEQSDFFLFTE